MKVKSENMKRDEYSLGLIGYPLGHSLSPQIHAAALYELGLNGEYVLYPIPPDENGMDQLKALLSQMRTGEIHGLNVTIPHKQTVMPLLDELTPPAQAIGAVNTIFLRDGRLVGDNTDAPGFWADVCEWLVGACPEHGRKGEWGVKPALVLGAGGSARAVVYALLTEAFHVTIAARRIEQARKISDQFSVFSEQLAVCELKKSPFTIHHSPLIINTTPVGMHPHPDATPWPAKTPFPKDAAIYDLVYNPPETLLVKKAHAAGLPATTGLGMLIEQAALAFERWMEMEAPRDAMREAVEK
jgi:shikimate dehydrogenase